MIDLMMRMKLDLCMKLLLMNLWMLLMTIVVGCKRVECRKESGNK